MTNIQSYPGFVIDSTTIAVDFWPSKGYPHLTHYFLTHAHRDHTKNLDSTWSNGPIFCSSITKQLVISLMQVDEEILHELEFETTHVMKLDDSETFNVTLIDANHCPGAVMYFFEGYFGRILATGDFRYSPDMFVDTPLSQGEVDICYLDNTYFNKCFKNLPSRKDALKELIAFLDSKREDDVIFKLFIRTIGKEQLLLDVYDYFKQPINVSYDRYERLTKIFNLNAECFTYTLNSDTWLYVEDDLNQDNEEFDEFARKKRVIRLEASALNANPHYFSLTTSDRIQLNAKSKNNYFVIAYSDHSSYDEIIEFVKQLQPKRLIPIVRRMLPKQIDTTDLSELDVYLSKKELPNCHDKYKLLLQSTTLVRRSSIINAFDLSKTNKKNNSAYMKKPRNPTPINTRFITTRRKGGRNKSEIEYETPEKDSKKTPSPIKKVISFPRINFGTPSPKRQSDLSIRIEKVGLGLDPIEEETSLNESKRSNKRSTIGNESINKMAKKSSNSKPKETNKLNRASISPVKKRKSERLKRKSAPLFASSLGTKSKKTLRRQSLRLCNKEKVDYEWKEINDCVEVVEIQTSDNSFTDDEEDQVEQFSSKESVSKKLNLDLDSTSDVSLKENDLGVEKATCSTETHAAMDQTEVINCGENEIGNEHLEIEIESSASDESYKSIIFESTIDDEFGDSSFVTSPSEFNIKTENEQTEVYVIRNQAIQYANLQEMACLQEEEKEQRDGENKDGEKSADENEKLQTNDGPVQNECDKADGKNLFEFMGNKLSAYKVELTDKELNKFIIDYVFDSFEF
jgi:hypothetical protein